MGEALAEYPAARLRLLEGLLDSQSEEVRSGARYAVEELCHERRSITPLAAATLGKRVLAGRLSDRRGHARILSRLGSAAAVEPLSAALDDEDPPLRGHAAVALAGLHDPRAIPVLIALLDDDRSIPKLARTLGGLGTAAREAIPALLDVLKCRPPREEILARNRPIEVAVVLGQIGPEARPAIPALIALMRSHPHTRGAVALALSQIGGPEAHAAVPLLKELIRSPDDFVRISAARYLWRLDRRVDQVFPVLMKQLQPGGSKLLARAADG